MRLRDYLSTLEREPIRMTLGLDGAEFTLLLKPLDRVEFEEITRKTTVSAIDPVTRQPTRKLDEKKLRQAIVDRVLIGWEGLTQGTIATMTRRVSVNGDAGKAVEFTTENATDLLEMVLGVENEIWRETLRAVERRDADEALEKKD